MTQPRKSSSRSSGSARKPAGGSKSSGAAKSSGGSRSSGAKKPTRSTASSRSGSSAARSGSSRAGSSRSGSSRAASGSSRSGSSSSRATARAQRDEGLRDQLQRLLDPREVMVMTRGRLQEALDDAVSRGRMTRDDATDLLGDLVRRGREQTDDLLSNLEGFITAPAGRVLREVDRARRATGIGPSFPILGYDDLTAAEVSERLRELSPPELRKVRDYERRNANRKSVLAAIEQQLNK